MKRAAKVLLDHLQGLTPKIALVLGSGLGGLVDAVTEPRRLSYGEIEGFPQSGVSGHSGEIVTGRLSGVPILILSGRSHYYEAGDAGAMHRPLQLLNGIGIETVMLTNAAGSLHREMAPGSVMMITDHINWSGMNPLIGQQDDRRFLDMSNAYDLEWRTRMKLAAADLEIPLHDGIYMWFSGPSFETPAEIAMARILGADAVGMSTVPEVILARFFGLRVAAASVITNYAAGMQEGALSHRETKDVAPIGGERLGAIIARMMADEI